MSSAFLPVVDRGHGGVPGAKPALCALWDVALAVKVRAERSRLSRALSIPEYIESWLALPDEGAHLLRVQRQGEHFSIEWNTRGGLEKRIEGSYRTIRPTRLTMGWNVDRDGERYGSLVRFGLCGEFGYTRVTLVHTGLADEPDYLWHKRMWEASLERLRRLFT